MNDHAWGILLGLIAGLVVTPFLCVLTYKPMERFVARFMPKIFPTLFLSEEELQARKNAK